MMKQCHILLQGRQLKTGDTTLFAKPVIGTIVPAPACLAILSKTPAPVKIAVIIINTLDVADDTSFSLSPAF